MNEYFIEDENSFYEIDPDCKIGLETNRRERGKGRFRTAERSSLRRRHNCSFVLLCLLFMKM